MCFGEKLQRLRKAKGWTQEELAAQICISRQALSKWEAGTAIPDTENILQISKLFGVSTDYLLNDEFESDADIPAVQNTSKTLVEKYNSILRIAIGSVFSFIGIVGMFIMGIIGATGDYEIAGNSYQSSVVIVRGFRAFLASRDVEWLFILCIISAIAGLLIIFVPMVKQKLNFKKK